MKHVIIFIIVLLLTVAPNCREKPPVDNDLDGYTVEQGDCDDNDYNTFPGAYEFCDEKDNDCNGKIDDGECKETSDPTLDQDQDHDGYTPKQGDCNDENPDINPKKSELCDNIDNNCNGRIDEIEACSHTEDLDWDGYSPSKGDCSDYDPTMKPDFPEICNDYKDNNCDGRVDEKECFIDDVPVRFYASGTWPVTYACSGICAYGLNFWVDVKVKNIAYTKEVWIEVSASDDWSNIKYYNLSYEGNLSDGYERWGVDVKGICQWSSYNYPTYGQCSTTLYRYKIFYKVNNETYWDDNYGRGFTINASYYYID